MDPRGWGALPQEGEGSEPRQEAVAWLEEHQVPSQALHMLIGSHTTRLKKKPPPAPAATEEAPLAPSSAKATGAFPRPNLATEKAKASSANAGEITIKKSGQRADQLAAKVLNPDLLDETKVPQEWREKWTKQVDELAASGASASGASMGAQSAGPKALNMEAKTVAEFKRIPGNIR
jgi:hypothetical protein